MPQLRGRYPFAVGIALLGLGPNVVLSTALLPVRESMATYAVAPIVLALVISSPDQGDSARSGLIALAVVSGATLVRALALAALSGARLSRGRTRVSVSRPASAYP